MANKPIMVDLTELWMEFIADGVCGLCGNSGLVTTETTTPRGKPTGVREAPCICPNGRQIKEHLTPDSDNG